MVVCCRCKLASSSIYLSAGRKCEKGQRARGKRRGKSAERGVCLHCLHRSPQVAQKLHMLQVELQLETAKYGDACSERGRVCTGAAAYWWLGDSSASRAAGLHQADSMSQKFARGRWRWGRLGRIAVR